MKLFTTDQHIHTPRCGHATGEPQEYVESALAQGLNQIIFTDHAPLPDRFDQEHRMKYEELGEYIRELETLRDRYAGHIRIGIGLECDWLPGLDSWYEHLRNIYPWDLLIGSVHFIGSFTDPEPLFIFARLGDLTPEQEEQYWRQQLTLAASGHFQVLGHMDLLKNENWKLPRGHRPLIFNLLKRIRRQGMSVEINASGFDRNGVNRYYPDRELLDMVLAGEVPLVYGSDAHRPEQVGRQREAIEHLIHDKRNTIND